jgi:hypothetical protein
MTKTILLILLFALFMIMLVGAGKWPLWLCISFSACFGIITGIIISSKIRYWGDK